jgi:hypothetical protein
VVLRLPGPAGMQCSSIPVTVAFLPRRSSECFRGVSLMKPRRHFPVMLGEYWVYILAGIISITMLILLYSHNDSGLLPLW